MVTTTSLAHLTCWYTKINRTKFLMAPIKHIQLQTTINKMNCYRVRSLSVKKLQTTTQSKKSIEMLHRTR